jgi:4-amino-4-deoxy-L-arabinose transferase-like glycosyltransferase
VRDNRLVTKWAKSHPWAASYAVVISAVVLFMILAAVAGFDDSAVVLFALCAVAMGGFLLDALRRQDDSQRDQTE